ncbi:ArgE/DapE family deacylase [bacterium]|nr:ArgE/DapE family deacylase [bacterium]
MSFAVDREYLISTLRELVSINSINPSLARGGKGEAEIAAFIAKSLGDIGLTVDLLEHAAGRASVVGVLKGNGTGKSLMLNAHIDTVDVEEMAEPFSARIENGKLYGRGAYDMKGSAAACITAAKALVDSGTKLSGDLVLALVADEEFESIGTQEVMKKYKTDAAIVTEPSELNICLAHKGFIWLEVEVVGRAAHGSRFEEGVDANMRMGRFLSELDKLEQSLLAQGGHALVGPPSLHAAMLEGGSGWSTYADRCRLKIERRTIPGETESKVIGEIQAIIDRLSADPTFKASLRTICVRDPFEVSEDTEIVKLLSETSETVLGAKPRFFGDTPWMDSAFLSAEGVETVVMGPAGQGAHSAVEWVDLESVQKLTYVLAETASSYCR